MKPEYVFPQAWLDAFNCPQCHVYCRQHWFHLCGREQNSGYGPSFKDDRFLVSNCERCNYPTIWHDHRMLFPLTGGAEPPNQDLGEDIIRDYEEARSIVLRSPRGAAALLRLAIQKLCIKLGCPGTDINKDIQALVANGLPPKVQQALDSVRVIGNEAVHPGTLDLRDDSDTAVRLFKLVNFIATKMITEPAEIEQIYSGLPAEKLHGIARRDAPPRST